MKIFKNNCQNQPWKQNILTWSMILQDHLSNDNECAFFPVPCNLHSLPSGHWHFHSFTDFTISLLHMSYFHSVTFIFKLWFVWMKWTCVPPLLIECWAQVIYTDPLGKKHIRRAKLNLVDLAGRCRLSHQPLIHLIHPLIHHHHHHGHHQRAARQDWNQHERGSRLLREQEHQSQPLLSWQGGQNDKTMSRWKLWEHDEPIPVECIVLG